MVAARGGDVDLAAMPAEAVQVVRECWEPVLVGRECAIHGDSGAGDVLVDGATVALLDWDESRVEVPWFDFAHLPLEVELVLPDAREKLTIAGLGGKRRRAGSRSPNTRAECCASCTAA